ncbi:MAG: hypothetical protein ABJA34_00165 [Pseudonocardiales bacterium]
MKPPAPNGRYADAPALSKALQAAHLACTHYQEDARHPDAQSQGRCLVRGVSVRLAVYASDWELNHQVSAMQSKPQTAGYHWFVAGKNWTVDCDIYQPIAEVIANRLKGVVIAIPPSPAPSH